MALRETPTRRVAEVRIASVYGIWDRRTTADAELLEELRLLLAESPELLVDRHQEDDGAWVLEAAAAALRSPALIYDQPTPVAMRLLYYGARAMIFAGVAVIVLAGVLWFMRQAQLAAYRRMFAASNRGNCPRCEYNLAGASGRLCPECGCEPRSIRREAMTVLDEADRRTALANRGRFV